MTKLAWDYYMKGRARPVFPLTPTADWDILLPDHHLLLGQMVTPINETFNGATFPPVGPAAASTTALGSSGAWSSPSIRYPSDLAWERTTSSPISGSGSASRPAAQTHNQNSSMGLELNLVAPARISFRWRLISEAGFDYLWVYVDGVNKLKSSGATQHGGRFVSDVLSPGVHTIDWRFTKDSSVTAVSEECLIDEVVVIPESQWDDRRQYIRLQDEFDFLDQSNRWIKTNAGGGAGTAALQTGHENGVVKLETGSTTNHSTELTKGSSSVGGFSYNREWIFEGRFRIATNTDVAAYLGLWDNGANAVSIEANTSVSTGFQLYSKSGGVVSRAATGIVFGTDFHTFRLIGQSTGQLSLFIDGTAVQLGSADRFVLSGISNATMREFIQCITLTNAARTLEVDWLQFLATR